MSARESIGQVIGKMWAPAVAAISRARHARMFHPRGHTFAGYTTTVEGPVGVVHSIRRAVYASSQHARPRLSQITGGRPG